MILSLIARVAGPAATLALLAALTAWPPEYTALYAVLAGYMQLATAPLNPYTEHFHLREILKGRSKGLGAGLVALGLLWIVAFTLVWFMGHSLLVLVIFPVLGLGHLLLKVRATRLRANRHNTLAIALEFSFRPMTLLVGTIFIFMLFGASDMGLEVAFGLTGLSTIAIASVLGFSGQSTAWSVPTTDNGSNESGDKTDREAGIFLFLGILMVTATQFEVFALDKVGSAVDLGTYKVALQLASVCTIATNFILMGKLRELYANDIQSGAYRSIFRSIQVQTFGLSLVFMAAFVSVGLVWPPIWPEQTWLLASGAAAIFSASAAFGPLTNWFFAAGRTGVVIASLLVMIAVKVVLFATLLAIDAISPAYLIGVYGAGLLAQNGLLLIMQRRAI